MRSHFVLTEFMFRVWLYFSHTFMQILSQKSDPCLLTRVAQYEKPSIHNISRVNARYPAEFDQFRWCALCSQQRTPEVTGKHNTMSESLTTKKLTFPRS